MLTFNDLQAVWMVNQQISAFVSGLFGKLHFASVMARQQYLAVFFKLTR